MIIYEVKSGDDIISISNKFGITVEQLMRDNGLSTSSNLVPGQTIVIAYPKQTHTVQVGDSLTSIATSYQVSLMQLLRNNPFLSNSEAITPGQNIVISYNTQGKITTHGICYPFIQAETLAKTLPFLTYLSIFNYAATSNGEIIPYHEDKEIIQKAQSYNVIPLMLSTTSTPLGTPNKEAAYDIIYNATSQENYITNTLTILKTKGYAGVNIVFNYINLATLEAYSAFILKVSNHLRKEGYLLFITINMNTASIFNDVPFEKTDFSTIEQNVDGMIFFHLIWGTNYEPPGPVSSNYLLTTLINYTLEFIPSQKITVGISLISYDWELPFIPGKSSANSLTINSTLRLASSVDATIQFDEISQTPYFMYILANSSKSVAHIVWSYDARTINSLTNLITQNQLKGAFLWNIMIFNPQMWLVINSQYDIIKY